MSSSFEGTATICRPTRITNNTATIIDNVFTNNYITSSSKTGLLLTGISDHLPVFYMCKSVQYFQSGCRPIKHRIINEKTINGLKNTLLSTDWQKFMN